MPAPHNPFKAALAAGQTQFGCWLSLGSPVSAELMGTAGFDWLLLDAEHTAYDVAALRGQLMALAASGSHAVVRVPVGETWILKQVLDLGAQSVLVPMVESAAQAQQIARAVKYPPDGTRGVGYTTTRASRFGAIGDYGTTADAQICLLVQVENLKGLEALDDILAVDGIDGVFVGPADLSADMGYMGQLTHPEVMETITGTLARIAAAGKAPGILSTDRAVLEAAMSAGARFVAVGLDSAILARGARALAKEWAAQG